MIEESKQDEQFLQSLQAEKKAYKDGVYDFSFHDRFIIYHFFLAGFYTYIALDKKTGLGSQVIKTKCRIKSSQFQNLTPAILFSIKYTGNVRSLGSLSFPPDRFIDMMFRQIMPPYGFTVREEQIRLCKCIYEGLREKHIALCEAEVGTGKTMAYLIAGLALKLCDKTSMIDHTPITISTSSIELQQAIITKEIPMLTKMLTESGLMARSIRAVVRKGKKHYFCLARYEDYYASLRKHPRKYSETLALLNKLCLPMNDFDLDMIPQLKSYINAKICVKGNCNQCRMADTCEYADFIRRSKTERLDFQITNHNLLLVSQRIKSVSDDGSGILKETPYCIIDEAHKLLDAAESVFGSEFDQRMIPEYLDSVRNTCDREKNVKEYRALIHTARGIHKSMINSMWEDRDPETEDDTKGRYLLHLSKQSSALIEKMIELLELIGGYKQNGQVIFNYRNMVGYRKGKDGQPEIISEEAETVRLIYDMFLSGLTARQICQKLKDERLPSKNGKAEWSPSTILSILKNERYTGDAILQKTYTIDPIQKTKRINHGEVPMYLVENNHPAIIDRKTFNKAQEELARRASKKSATPKNTIAGKGRYSRYALSEVLRCGCCGTLYRRTLWTAKGTKRAVWRCCKRMDYGKQYCPDSHSVNETELHAGIVRAMDRFTKEDATRFHDTVKASIAEAIGLNDESPEEITIKHKIGLLNQEIMTLVDLSLSEDVPLEEYEDKFADISAEIGTLNARLEAINSAKRTGGEKEKELTRLQMALDRIKNCNMEYNDSAVRQMVECVKVYPDGKLEVIFGGGYTITEQVEVLK